MDLTLLNLSTVNFIHCEGAVEKEIKKERCTRVVVLPKSCQFIEGTSEVRGFYT